MRTTLLLLLLAVPCSAATMVRFENDTNYRWDIGTPLNPFVSSAEQDGLRGAWKFFRADGVPDNVSEWGVFTGASLGNGVGVDEIQYVTDCRYDACLFEPLVLDEPRPLDMYETEDVVFAWHAKSDFEKFVLPETATIPLLSNYYHDLGLPRGRVSGWVELERREVFWKPAADSHNAALPIIDYQPTAWGYFIHDPEPGDYNGDAFFTVADYTVWRDTLGSESDLRADGDGDGVITQADYDVWRSIYTGGVSASGAAVPEPGAVWLVLLAAAICGLRRRIV